jgi:hypothetical protein
MFSSSDAVFSFTKRKRRMVARMTRRPEMRKGSFFAVLPDNGEFHREIPEPRKTDSTDNGCNTSHRV